MPANWSAHASAQQPQRNNHSANNHNANNNWSTNDDDDDDDRVEIVGKGCEIAASWQLATAMQF